MLGTGQAQGVLLRQAQKSGAAPLSLGWHNELLNSQSLPKYTNLVLAGVVFSATLSPNAITFSTPSGSLYQGSVMNPAGSGKNLVLLHITVLFQESAGTPSTTSIGVGLVATTNVGVNASVGDAPQNLLIGSNIPSVASTSTLETFTVGGSATPLRTIGAVYSDLTAGSYIQYFKEQIDGAIIAPPGASFSLQSTSVAISGGVCFVWAELPI